MTFVLPRLQRSVPVVDAGGTPAFAFHVWWDQFAEAIENALNSIQDQVTDIATIQTQLADQLAQIEAAQAAADAAQTTANTANINAGNAQTTANTAVSNAAAAQNTATAVKKTDKISGSWTSPGSVLSAVDAGTNASVTVAAHTRKWGDSTSNGVNSHTFTGLSYSTTYFVYYDDPNQNDTTPAYQITTNPNTAAHNSATNRVYVGSIVTPASGGTGTSGGTTPPGGGYTGPGEIP